MASTPQLQAFPALLRQHRTALGLTQEALAERGGLSRRGIQNLERGVATPYRDTVRRLADALALATEDRLRFEQVATATPRRGAPCRGRASSAAAAHNLPVPLTPLIGRQRDVAAIARLLLGGRATDEGGFRAVTLTGTAGIGKTRLAIHVASGLVPAFPDGACVVDLAALTDPEQVPHAIAQALGLRSDPTLPIQTALTEALRDRDVLLVLDNCEHLLQSCARTVETLLRSCARLRVLATSREALGLAGEALWPVPALAVPPEPLPTASTIAGYEAVRLFVARAAAVLPGFAVTEGNASAIAQVCRRLDGIPLALELAAPWANVLPVDQLASRLGDRLDLLERSSRAPLTRHHTLRAAIDWSYALLSEDERALFNRLAAFSGGWDLRAADAVCAAGIANGGALRVLRRLVSASLVTADLGDADATRFHLLDTLRQYAREQLAASGELEEMQDRHADYYLKVAEHAEPRSSDPDPRAWLDRVEIDQDNLRTALDWYLEYGTAERAVRLYAALYRLWMQYGSPEIGNLRSRLTALLDLTRRPLATEVRVQALEVAGCLSTQTGDPPEGRRLLEEALAIRRQDGDGRKLADTLTALGHVVRELGDYPAARAYLEEALRLHRAAGDRVGEAMALDRLGNVAHYQGDVETARPLFERALELWRAQHAQFLVGFALQNLGLVALDVGDLRAARSWLAESIEVRRDLGDTYGLVRSLALFAALRGREGQPGRAACLAGAVAELSRGTALLDIVIHRERLRDAVLRARRDLGEDAYAAAWAGGQAMTLEQAIAEALDRGT